ncbi:MAG: hypothetical protein EA339_01350 [Rhodobacteraceae bacterium]|nr:MAG: hypothetical protein EA339_01350 [Paracoccaceae bacterium]
MQVKGDGGGYVYRRRFKPISDTHAHQSTEGPSAGAASWPAKAVWKLLRHEKPSVGRVCSRAFGLFGFMQPAGGADIAPMRAV